MNGNRDNWCQFNYSTTTPLTSMVFMQAFLSVVSPDSFLPFVPVSLSSVSAPCPYPSCLCLPSRTSFFHCSAPWFTTTTRKEPMAPLACACAFGSVADPARLVVVNERFERNRFPGL